jgi:hypothetical protein
MVMSTVPLPGGTVSLKYCQLPVAPASAPMVCPLAIGWTTTPLVESRRVYTLKELPKVCSHTIVWLPAGFMAIAAPSGQSFVAELTWSTLPSGESALLYPHAMTCERTSEAAGSFHVTTKLSLGAMAMSYP